MISRKWILMACLIVIGSLAAYRSAAWLPVAQAAKEKEESLEVRYARAQLQFAEAPLRKAQHQNRRVRETISAGLLAEYSDAVQVAKAQLTAAQDPGGDDSLAAWVRR